MSIGTELITEIDPDGLSRILTEVLRAHEQFISDANVLDTKAQGIVQINLVVLGLVFSVSGSEHLSAGWTNLSKLAMFLSIIVLAVSALSALISRNRGGLYWTGTIYPNVLMQNVGLDKSTIEYELLKNLNSVFYANRTTYLKRSRFVAISNILQFIGLLILSIDILLIVARVG